MSLEDLRRRLTRIEASQGDHGPFGFPPVLQIVTRDDADRDQQLAALEAAGEYRPGQFVIDRRIVSPDPAMRAQHEAEMRVARAERLHS